MRINNNISAIITNKKLLGNETSLANSMERLASGLKINHASDNPSGMAIASKMRAQIKGLDQASRNSSDGTSVIQTADGAMGEITNMLQRMHELAVQAANGTNAQAEKDSIQLEIKSLREEVDRIAKTTEFNTKGLLDGSLDARVYPDSASQQKVSRVSVSDSVVEDIYEFEIESASKNPSMTVASSVNAFVGHDGVLDLNGEKIAITSSMTKEEVYEALRNGAEHANCELDVDMAADDPITFVSKEYGAHAEIKFTYTSEDPDFMATDAVGATMPNLAVESEADPALEVGEDAKIKMQSGFSETTTVTYDGNHVKFTDTNGFSMEMLLTKEETGSVSLNVTDIGIMDLQVGANMGQTMQIRIPAMDANSLYLDEIDVSTVNGAKKAMDQITAALNKVSSVRSQLGAFENRLDYTVDSLDQTGENMTSALSRIEDVDMAIEMSEYTKLNVLEQAGTSALAQANQLPELALQLLQ